MLLNPLVVISKHTHLQHTHLLAAITHLREETPPPPSPISVIGIPFEKMATYDFLTELLITQLSSRRSADFKFKYGHVRKGPAVGLPVY